MVTLTDASFASGGDRSPSGLCIFIAGRLVHWASTKQQVTAMSSCEAELDAAILGVKQAQGVAEALRELDPETAVVQILNTDSASAIQSMKNVATTWRNRHFAVRASWMRDFVDRRDIKVEYKLGKELEADLLTKVID